MVIWLGYAVYVFFLLVLVCNGWGKILLIKYNVLFKLSFPLGICGSVAGLSPRGRRGYHSVRDFSCPVIFRSFRFAIW